MKKTTNQFPLFNFLLYVIVLIISSSCDNSGEIINGSVKDIDGNSYHIIQIGTQIWMVENLRVTKYNNGNKIQNILDTDAWNMSSVGAQCTYNNTSNIDSINKLGRLYNWYTIIDKRKIAPKGWHVPTNTDWSTLVSYLESNGCVNNDLIKNSLITKTDWMFFSILKTNNTLTNSTGFSALPAGVRGDYGAFAGYGDYASWWSSTKENSGQLWGWSIQINPYMIYYYGLDKVAITRNTSGQSIRCIKD